MSNRIQNKHKCINHLHHVAVKKNSPQDVVKRLAKLEKINLSLSKQISFLLTQNAHLAARVWLLENREDVA